MGVNECAVPRPRVLFFVEGFTDIRFVIGLSEICDLTMVVPALPYRSSGLKDRVADAAVSVEVQEIPGGRLAFQLRSIAHLMKTMRRFDVVLSQEVLRGSLNATLVGRLLGVPVVTYMGISPVEYFRCRWERGQIGTIAAWLGEFAIRGLMVLNGRLARRCLAMGPYLEEVARAYCDRTTAGLYYGVDTERFCPADEAERRRLRQLLNLPVDRFLVLLSSRISHEKDPETVLMAVHRARQQGLDAVVINLGGGYREFLALAASLGLGDTSDWVMARPAVHPIHEVHHFYRAVDAVALASLAEGAAFSTLEALACGTPLLATAVGGMAIQLPGYASLTPRQDPEAMAQALLDVGSDPAGARERARRGRAYVCREWSRARAFSELRRVLDEAAGRPDSQRVAEAA